MKRYHVEVAYSQNVIDSIYSMVGSMVFKGSHHFNSSPRHLPLPTKDLLKGGRIIEYYVDNNQVIKAVFRCKYNNVYDICYVVKPNGFIVTAWLNNSNDEHHTLDHSLYEKEC